MPPGQINQQLIYIGARALDMYQPTTLKVQMDSANARGVADRQATSAAGSANPGNDGCEMMKWLLSLACHCTLLKNSAPLASLPLSSPSRQRMVLLQIIHHISHKS